MRDTFWGSLYIIRWSILGPLFLGNSQNLRARQRREHVANNVRIQGCCSIPETSYIYPMIYPQYNPYIPPVKKRLGLRGVVYLHQ